jgi:hypothetical protein
LVIFLLDFIIRTIIRVVFFQNCEPFKDKF